jgi:hypothetical protein
MDIVTMNNDFDERYYDSHETEMLYLGRADEDIYVYASDAKRYEVRSMEEACCEVYESFETFAQLFLHVAGGRLGWNSDPDEEQYEHEEGRYDGEV